MFPYCVVRIDGILQKAADVQLLCDLVASL